MPVTSYSTTAANNNSAPPNGAPEGWPPAAVNDTIRQIMADIAVEAQTNAVKVLGSVAGTNTITGSMSPALAAYSGGMIVVFEPAATNTGTATIAINGLAAIDIRKGNNVALAAGDLVAGAEALMVYDGTSGVFLLINPHVLINTAGALNSSADEVGYKGVPQNSQSGNYTLVLSDAGKHIVHPSGGGAGDTYTIPANASVAYPIGTVITFANADSNSITIAITTDTLTLAGTTTTGSRTLAQNGIATALKIASTSWLFSGTGVS